MNLSLDDHRINNVATIIDRDETAHLDLGRALVEKLARFPIEIILVSLEQVGGDLPRLVFDLSAGNRTGGAGNRSAPAGIRSQSVGRRIGVALFDQDIANREAKLFGNDLRIR